MSGIPICRTAQICLLGYNVSDRKDVEWTAHGTELGWKNVELEMSEKGQNSPLPTVTILINAII